MLKRSFMILCIHIFCVLFMGCGKIKPEFKVMESGYESQKEELDENNTDMPEKIDDSKNRLLAIFRYSLVQVVMN